MKPADAAIFPKYPNALVNCPSGATACTPPASVASHLTTQVSAFSPNFQTPYTEQASLTLEYGIGAKLDRLRQLSLRARRASDSLARRQPAQAEDHRVSGVRRPVGLHGRLLFGGVVRDMANHALGGLSVSAVPQRCAASRSAAGHHQFVRERGQQRIQRSDAAAEGTDQQATVRSRGLHLRQGDRRRHRTRWWWAVPATCRTPMPRNWSADSASPISAIASLPPRCTSPLSFHYEQRGAECAVQQLEGLDRVYRGLGTADQRDHGGRRQSRRQHLQRSPARGGEKRLHRPRLFHCRCCASARDSS